MKTLYFLPHFDDEIFIIPKIRQDLEKGHSPLFIFFMSSNSRYLESLSLLKTMGISEENIFLIGENYNAHDGKLLKYLPEFYRELCLKFIEDKNNIEIVCPAYEGGHQDHDAISLLARAMAYKWNVKILEFFLYHGYGTRGKLYFVSSHFRALERLDYKYHLKDYLLLLKTPFIYKSQKTAFLGLWPFLMIKSFFFPLVLRVQSKESLIVTKHLEVPLYERWGRITEEQFLATVKGFENISPVLEFTRR